MRYVLLLLLASCYVVIANHEQADPIKFKIAGANGVASFLLSNGKVTASGVNGWCVLGLGYTDLTKKIHTPETVIEDSVVDLACTWARACCAVKSNGKVYCWGSSGNYQMGDNQRTTNRCSPTEVPNLTGIDAIRAGKSAFQARKSSDGSLVAWGLSSDGELCTDDGANNFAKTPTACVDGPTNVVEWAMNEKSSVARTSSGELYTTGTYGGRGEPSNYAGAKKKYTRFDDTGGSEWDLEDVCTGQFITTKYQATFCIDASNGQVYGWVWWANNLLAQGDDAATTCGSCATCKYFGPCKLSSTSDKKSSGITVGTFSGNSRGSCTASACLWLNNDGSIWYTGNPDSSSSTVSHVMVDDCASDELCYDGTDVTAAVKMDDWGTDNADIGCTETGCFILKNDDTIKAVGRNLDGELGTGNYDNDDSNTNNDIYTSLFVIASAAPATCAEDHFGDNGACSPCPSDSTRAAGDDPTCTDCTCACKADFFGNNGVCTACTEGTNPAGDDPASTSACECAENERSVYVAAEPGPSYTHITGVNATKQLILHFNKVLADKGTVADLANEIVITGTYTIPGGETYSDEKWDGGTVISEHDLEADAVTACNGDNDCVGIDQVTTSTSAFSYTYTTLYDGGDDDGSLEYCGPEWWSVQTAESFCSGTLIEAKAFSTAFDGYSANQIYNQYKYTGQTVSDYCKDLGNCGCYEADVADSSSFTKDTVFRFYETNGCTMDDHGLKTNDCSNQKWCTLRYDGSTTTTTTTKWRAIKGTTTRVASTGDTAKTLGTAASTTGALPITSVDVSGSNSDVVITLGKIEAPGAYQTLLDTTTITTVAYTSSGHLQDANTNPVLSFSGGLTETAPTKCLTGTFPCAYCEACPSHPTHGTLVNDAGDKLSATSYCNPSGTPTACSINQHVIDFTCTNCPAGKHNIDGASLTNHATPATAKNFCCDYGYYANTAGNACEPRTCAADQYVSSNGFCTPCVNGKRDAGDQTHNGETACYDIPSADTTDSSVDTSADIADAEDVGQKVADINGDGKLDVIYYVAKTPSNPGANALVVYKNTGTNANPTYEHYYSLPKGDLGFTVIEELYLADLNGDGHDDILIAEVPTKNTDGKSGKFRILQGKADGFENNQAGAADYQQYPFTIYDKNGDGWLDVCAAGGEKSQRCQMNDKSTGNIDGTGWGTNDGTDDVRGNCATAKYAGVALDEGMTVGQLVADPCAGDTLNQLELFVHDNYITDLSTSSRRRLRRFLLSSTTNSVTDAVWADFDGDGIKELAILTDDGSGNNELFIMSVEETESISYTTTTGINHDTSVTAAMSTHTTEAAAKTACDSARLEPGQAVFSTGLDFSCQVLRDRTVKCMGNNLHGALGKADELGSHACVAITPYLADVTNVESISAGDHFACAVIVGGTVKCWGKNDKGQCGLGDTTDPKKTPTAVSITNVRQISTGYDVACAVLTDNTVKCWGSNAGGAAYTASNTGDHAIEDEPIVVDAALTDVSFVSCGGANTNDMGSHCCALKTNGAVICWGNGAGLGSSITNSPHDLTTYLDGSSNGNKAIWVTAGGDQVCVVKHDKSVWCLGDNKQGAVGNNGADDAYDSLQDTGLRKVSKVECHINHCCALKEDKTIWCWGWSTCKDQATCDNDEDANDVDFNFHKGDQSASGNLWGSGVSGGWKVPTETAWSGAIDIFVSTVHLCFRQENNEIRCYGSEDDERNCNPQIIGLDLSWCDHCACGGYQYTLAKQWEVVPSPISYKSTPAQAMTESCRNSETGSFDDKVSYFPKSCNDLAKDDDQLWCMASGTSSTESGNYNDYVPGADLGAAEPSSLDDVGTECQFDSEVDVKDSAKLDVCFTTANNWYAQQCKMTTDCAGFSVRWGGTATNVDPLDYSKDDNKDTEFWHRGFKKFGDKYVPVTTNLKVSTATSYPYNG